ncbi:uncharacterized protein KY384_000392 [Bacidia gigantensis]|uniref:uncharacterized protein n=1 Tax=Bacidia gigantensis TaxID=2732470 RepID=UPI001D05A51C|nr:uncharacterized protein KY384_000392 [Bacidia gigantensis]KAG8526398.1 hypothetical protein KY384_000392 [Bacidia gigantensis]
MYGVWCFHPLVALCSLLCLISPLVAAKSHFRRAADIRLRAPLNEARDQHLAAKTTPDNTRQPLPADYRANTEGNHDHYHLYNYGGALDYGDFFLAITSAQTWLVDQLINDVYDITPHPLELIDERAVPADGYTHAENGVEFSLTPATPDVDYDEFFKLLTGFAKLCAQFQIREFDFVLWFGDTQHEEDIKARGYLRVLSVQSQGNSTVITNDASVA